MSGIRRNAKGFRSVFDKDQAIRAHRVRMVAAPDGAGSAAAASAINAPSLGPQGSAGARASAR